MGSTSLLDAAAIDLAAMVRSREVSPLELVDAHIARIGEVNRSINAMVADRFELARREAREAGETLARGASTDELPALFGVPCTVKEFIAVGGMPHTAGLKSRRAVRAERDATVVERIRRAGAIVLGVTNGPEGGLWNESHNDLYGRTNNPWNLGRTPGGSSGGEAALVASGGSPFGIGGDIGGSIRGPAAMCGTVGHKPSGRMVPNTGQHPGLHGELYAFNCLGPLLRRVRDVMPILRVIAGPDGMDPVTRDFTLGDPSTVDLKDVTVFPVETNGRQYATETVRAVVRRSAEALEARGARLAKLETPRMRLGFEIWSAMMAEVGTSYVDILGGDDGRVPLMRELFLWPFGRSRHTAPALLVATAETIGRRLGIKTERFLVEGQKLAQELRAELGDHGVILHPPYTRAAPRHNAPLLTPFDSAYTAIFNVMEMPVTEVPVGFDKRGLPLGVQVAASPGNDHLTVAVASAIEEAFGGWTRAEPHRLPERRTWLRSILPA